MSQDKLVLIRQALAAAESSIKTAKQLLSEVESGGLHVSAKDLPGVAGVFDGVNMVGENGGKMEVPANYASKSMLVVGDTLKQVEENGEKRFKQIEHVKRHKTTGILHKKDGKFKVITPEGSYNVLESAVEHFKGSVGDEVILHLPAGNLTASHGAIERIVKPGEVSESSVVEVPMVGEVAAQVPAASALPEVENKKDVPRPTKEAPRTDQVNPRTPARPKNKKKPAARRVENPSVSQQPARPAPAQRQEQPAAVSIPAPGEDDELR